MSTVIHIGFPKTASTTLQKHFFPILCKQKGYIYNPSEFRKISKQRFTYSKEDKIALSGVIAGHKILISSEGLLDLNPRNWESAADRVLDLFGTSAKIIILVRPPIDYLSSIYTQKVQEGNILRAEDFFVTSDEYKRLEEFLPKRNLTRYDYTKFDYNELIKLYKMRFDEVYLIPISRINTLYPFDKIFSLKENDIKKYRKILQNCPQENKSYSQLATKLTFLRESVLGWFLLRSLGSEDLPKNNDLINLKTSSKNLTKRTFKNKIYLLLRKELINRFHHLFRWRWWMQNVLDRIYPYKKYTLPDSVKYKLNNDLNKKNSQLLDELETYIDKRY